ncbi:hypothetical protein HDV00_007195 [Rhizophlyctis rosea]|nr:hypothetical protein HDV00_007195 [Rhizophlyctis rosea]
MPNQPPEMNTEVAGGPSERLLAPRSAHVGSSAVLPAKFDGPLPKHMQQARFSMAREGTRAASEPSMGNHSFASSRREDESTSGGIGDAFTAAATILDNPTSVTNSNDLSEMDVDQPAGEGTTSPSLRASTGPSDEVNKELEERAARIEKLERELAAEKRLFAEASSKRKRAGMAMTRESTPHVDTSPTSTIANTMDEAATSCGASTGVPEEVEDPEEVENSQSAPQSSTNIEEVIIISDEDEETTPVRKRLREEFDSEGTSELGRASADKGKRSKVGEWKSFLYGPHDHLATPRDLRWDQEQPVSERIRMRYAPAVDIEEDGQPTGGMRVPVRRMLASSPGATQGSSGRQRKRKGVDELNTVGSVDSAIPEQQNQRQKRSKGQTEDVTPQTPTQSQSTLNPHPASVQSVRPPEQQPSSPDAHLKPSEPIFSAPRQPSPRPHRASSHPALSAPIQIPHQETAAASTDVPQSFPSSSSAAPSLTLGLGEPNHNQAAQTPARRQSSETTRPPSVAPPLPTVAISEQGYNVEDVSDSDSDIEMHLGKGLGAGGETGQGPEVDSDDEEGFTSRGFVHVNVAGASSSGGGLSSSGPRQPKAIPSIAQMELDYDTDSANIVADGKSKDVGSVAAEAGKSKAVGNKRNGPAEDVTNRDDILKKKIQEETLLKKIQQERGMKKAMVIDAVPTATSPSQNVTTSTQSSSSLSVSPLPATSRLTSPLQPSAALKDNVDELLRRKIARERQNTRQGEPNQIATPTSQSPEQSQSKTSAQLPAAQSETRSPSARMGSLDTPETLLRRASPQTDPSPSHQDVRQNQNGMSGDPHSRTYSRSRQESPRAQDSPPTHRIAEVRSGPKQSAAPSLAANALSGAKGRPQTQAQKEQDAFLATLRRNVVESMGTPASTKSRALSSSAKAESGKAQGKKSTSGVAVHSSNKGGESADAGRASAVPVIWLVDAGSKGGKEGAAGRDTNKPAAVGGGSSSRSANSLPQTNGSAPGARSSPSAAKSEHASAQTLKSILSGTAERGVPSTPAERTRGVSSSTPSPSATPVHKPSTPASAIGTPKTNTPSLRQTPAATPITNPPPPTQNTNGPTSAFGAAAAETFQNQTGPNNSRSSSSPVTISKDRLGADTQSRSSGPANGNLEQRVQASSQRRHNTPVAPSVPQQLQQPMRSISPAASNNLPRQPPSQQPTTTKATQAPNGLQQRPSSALPSKSGFSGSSVPGGKGVGSTAVDSGLKVAGRPPIRLSVSQAVTAGPSANGGSGSSSMVGSMTGNSGEATAATSGTDLSDPEIMQRVALLLQAWQGDGGSDAGGNANAANVGSASAGIVPGVIPGNWVFFGRDGAMVQNPFGGMTGARSGAGSGQGQPMPPREL